MEQGEIPRGPDRKAQQDPSTWLAHLIMCPGNSLDL